MSIAFSADMFFFILTMSGVIMPPAVFFPYFKSRLTWPAAFGFMREIICSVTSGSRSPKRSVASSAGICSKMSAISSLSRCSATSTCSCSFISSKASAEAFGAQFLKMICLSDSDRCSITSAASTGCILFKTSVAFLTSSLAKKFLIAAIKILLRLFILLPLH